MNRGQDARENGCSYENWAANVGLYCRGNGWFAGHGSRTGTTLRLRPLSGMVNMAYSLTTGRAKPLQPVQSNRNSNTLLAGATRVEDSPRSLNPQSKIYQEFQAPLYASHATKGLGTLPKARERALIKKDKLLLPTSGRGRVDCLVCN